MAKLMYFPRKQYHGPTLCGGNHEFDELLSCNCPIKTCTDHPFTQERVMSMTMEDEIKRKATLRSNGVLIG
jgi:hypothetical protein